MQQLIVVSPLNTRLKFAPVGGGVARPMNFWESHDADVAVRLSQWYWKYRIWIHLRRIHIIAKVVVLWITGASISTIRAPIAIIWRPRITHVMIAWFCYLPVWYIFSRLRSHLLAPF